MDSHKAARLAVPCLTRPPTPHNWSDYPNIWDEVQYLVHDCEWYKVYDIIEGLYDKLANDYVAVSQGQAPRFAAEINNTFLEEGIGWQLVDGQVITRGDEAFENTVQSAVSTLTESGQQTAASHT